jgi:WhiB family transcriptional regulator, redox-sensing transcriptional regulator
MYATITGPDIRLDIHPDDQVNTCDVDGLFDERAFETPVRPPAPRCADGHGTLSALFFSDDVIDIARAKAICSKCALAPSCLEGALERAEPWGVWGGELIDTGRIVVHKRPRGRPPKHPRPQLGVDEGRRPAHLVA